MTEPYDEYDDDDSADKQPVDFIAMPIFRHFKPETLTALTRYEWLPGATKGINQGRDVVIDACPLAWCLFYEERFVYGAGDSSGMPGADQIAAALCEDDPTELTSQLHAIEREAFDFYNHWDNTEIADLSLAVHGPRAE